MRKKETGVNKLKNSKDGYKINQNVSFIEEICSSTWKDVYRFIYYKVGNREEAEDITQETYAKALDFLQREPAVIDNYNNYLKTIAMNILRDQWRKKSRMGVLLDIEEINAEELATEDFTEASAKRDLIEAAMNKLNLEERRVIELRIVKGYSTSETARVLGKKESNIRVMQYRALQALAAILKNYL